MWKRPKNTEIKYTEFLGIIRKKGYKVSNQIIVCIWIELNWNSHKFNASWQRVCVLNWHSKFSLFRIHDVKSPLKSCSTWNILYIQLMEAAISFIHIERIVLEAEHTFTLSLSASIQRNGKFFCPFKIRISVLNVAGGEVKRNQFSQTIA